MLWVKSLAKTNEVANITISERPAKCQRIELSLEKRTELIKCVEAVPKPTLKALSDKFGIGKSTVGDILKKKEVYKAKYGKIFVEHIAKELNKQFVYDDEEKHVDVPGSNLSQKVLNMVIKLKNFAFHKDEKYLQLVLELEKLTTRKILHNVVIRCS